jgi:hypothetical protein
MTYRRSTKVATNAHRTLPVFEPLEDRRLFSVSLVGGVLQVTTGSGNDTISVDEVADQPDGSTTMYVNVNGVESSFLGEETSSLAFNTGAGNDSVTVSFCGGAYPVTASLGAGNDTFILEDDGAYHPCEIHGGDGNDSIVTGQADDLLDGGPGNDTLNAGDGNDQIIPGGGTDSIIGGAGDDIGANYNDMPLRADGSAIQAENFDEGGDGHGYHDTDSNDIFGDTYRPDTGVDIFSGNGSTGHAVGSFVPTEWLAYTVNVPTTGVYNFSANYATPLSGMAMTISSDGHALASNVSLPATAGWGTYANRTTQVSLTAGTHVIRIANAGANAFNLDYFRLSLAPTSISGTVYNDANQNLHQDGGEHGIAGIRVYLDTNNNGHWDVGETSTLSSSTGGYTFNNVHVGTVHVREELPGGMRYVVGGATHYDVNVTAGSSNSGKNFALTSKTLISGRVFLDANGNKTLDSGEHGLGGWIVYVDLNNDGLFEAGEASKTTDSNGNFTFSGLDAGSCTLRVLGPTGYQQTTPISNGGLHVTASAGQIVNAGVFGERAIG